MGFPVTVVLGASGRIGALLRVCWPQETGTTEQIRWQSRRPLPPIPFVEAEAAPTPEHSVLLDPLAESERLVALLQGAEVVLCLAGSIPGRGGDLADNSRLAEATIRAAQQAALQSSCSPAPRVLLASSAAVYGREAGPLQEAAQACPANAYGAAKLEMEQRAQELGATLGVAVTALRIGNIAGLDAILGGWQPDFALDQFSDGLSPRRSYIGSVTLARVLAALVRQSDLPSLLNLAHPGPIEMAALLRAAGLEFAWRPALASAISEVELDVSRLRQVLSEVGDAHLQTTLSTPADAAQMVAEWMALQPPRSTGKGGRRAPLKP